MSTALKEFVEIYKYKSKLSPRLGFESRGADCKIMLQIDQGRFAFRRPLELLAIKKGASDK